MKIAIIGRSELLYNVTTLLIEKGYDIPLIITAKEAPEYKIKSKDFENLALKIGAKFIQTPKINRTEIKEQIIDCGDIDIAVSINYSGIIEEEIISLFKIGILNAHGGDLPRYRGNACQAWAILNEESKIAMCIHKMIGGELDSGDIIERDYLSININSRIGDIYKWMELITPKLILKAIEKLHLNPEYFLSKQSNLPKDALRCYPRLPVDGRINWLKSNLEILRLINASSEPFSGAFCYFSDKKLIIWRAEIIEDDENYLAVVGQVSRIVENVGIEIICGKGKLLITEIEFDGNKTVASEIINSIRKRLN
jgi:methionyl-tRNA formyltransferase